ncbi:hypothetical protein BK131_19180 [Paenibacillus amylolyticus]|uniref:Gfo/Idh/MocA family oxidoreductase n=1 Tax=Paenibacillus amylolyticus TaxID=1451 RepID=A0A1R1BQP1_PAEAM|nr:Gfo/Idh/MocA family oxidoreductase [Paenibacillus amylolyticus]OMF12128.1 hypothetical protein BK131_19180 [Paenibacillus amylolyticus]
MAVNIAIVGYGSAGRQHAKTLLDMNHASLYGIYEKNPIVDTDSVYRFTSWEELLSNPDVNAIALCLPPGGRANKAFEALDAGKSVLLEKPPCTTEKELDQLLKAANDANQTIGIMFQHRYRLPEEAFNVNWDHQTTAILEVSRPRDINRYFNDWRQDPALSFGGITAHLGIHYLDLACQMLGEPISFHQAGRREFSPGIDLRTVGTIEFSTGAAMSFVVTCEAEARKERLSLYGPDIRLTIEDGRSALEYKGNLRQYPVESTHEMRKQLYMDFASSIINKEQPERCHLQGGRGVTRLLEQIAMNGGIHI